MSVWLKPHNSKVNSHKYNKSHLHGDIHCNKINIQGTAVFSIVSALAGVTRDNLWEACHVAGYVVSSTLPSNNHTNSKQDAAWVSKTVALPSVLYLDRSLSVYLGINPFLIRYQHNIMTLKVSLNSIVLMLL